jgi:hypothetical protein
MVSPKEMQHFAIDVAVHRTLLLAAYRITTIAEGAIRPYTYFYDYIGNLLYHLKFVVERTRDNLTLVDPIHGCLFVAIEAILPRQGYPPDGVNTWTLLQHKDVLIRERE